MPRGNRRFWGDLEWGWGSRDADGRRLLHRPIVLVRMVPNLWMRWKRRWWWWHRHCEIILVSRRQAALFLIVISTNLSSLETKVKSRKIEKRCSTSRISNTRSRRDEHVRCLVVEYSSSSTSKSNDGKSRSAGGGGSGHWWW